GVLRCIPDRVTKRRLCELPGVILPGLSRVSEYCRAAHSGVSATREDVRIIHVPSARSIRDSPWRGREPKEVLRHDDKRVVAVRVVMKKQKAASAMIETPIAIQSLIRRSSIEMAIVNLAPPGAAISLSGLGAMIAGFAWCHCHEAKPAIMAPRPDSDIAAPGGARFT